MANADSAQCATRPTKSSYQIRATCPTVGLRRRPSTTENPEAIFQSVETELYDYHDSRRAREALHPPYNHTMGGRWRNYSTRLAEYDSGCSGVYNYFACRQWDQHALTAVYTNVNCADHHALSPENILQVGRQPYVERLRMPTLQRPIRVGCGRLCRSQSALKPRPLSGF